MSDEERQLRLGLACGFAAYLLWGLMPFYFKLLDHVGAAEIVSHRIVWLPLMLLPVIWFAGQFGGLAAILRQRRILAALALSALLIAINWLVYIWAVTNEHIVAASLGYFLNPLVNVLLGVFVLGERLRRWQVAAVALAALGVAILATGALDTLWISLTLAISFGLYGLVRKLTPVTALQGLAIETAILAPASLGWLIWLGTSGALAFGVERATDALLVFGAVVTAIPLLMFAGAARRLRLSTLGLLQYVAPSLQFATGVFVYGEPLGPAQFACFALIWAGLAIYTADSLRAARAERVLARGVVA